ncbi:DUF563 domain-containing protein [Microlunatus sp. Gsoil 973]|uniref:glycosyltransferase family 61 protein n=1 Tax=Microlunatus sp. Gsoil 973 TaxID=2672569 RepID=UPI0018A880EE|nr:glycosyltransferase 61 family protein [Microlunatus sp. Gsoil 973]
MPETVDMNNSPGGAERAIRLAVEKLGGRSGLGMVGKSVGTTARRSLGLARRIAGPRAGRHPDSEGRRKVFVIADRMPPGALRPYLEPYWDDELHVVAPEPQVEWGLDGEQRRYHKLDQHSNVRWHLKLHGPVDVIVYVRRGTSAKHEAALRQLLFHLAPGGSYVIPMAKITGYTQGRDLGRCLATMLAGLADGKQAASAQDYDELLWATSSVTVDRDFIRIGKRGRHYLKLSDRSTNRMLGSRNHNVAVRQLELLSRGELTSSGQVDSIGATRELVGLDPAVKYPPMHLREYRGRIGFVSNSLVFTDNEILPDSFRHHLAGDLRNPRMVNVDESFARLDEHVRPQETIDGAFYLLDSENSGHFGHLMTEVISRLWGWPRAKEENPDLKVIFRLRHVNERNPELEQTVFTAYGIQPDDIVWVDHPVYLQTAYGATPMFHNAMPHYVHPQIRTVWRRLRDGLDRSGAPQFDRVFLSRRDTLGNRRCLNRVAVEERFAAEGFEIVYPEDYPLRHQAGMLEHARIVAGFGGSAMFNTLFAENLEQMIVLNQEAYTARNEHLIALALGADIHYLWNVPEIQQPEEGWSREAYKSNWTFDFSRLGTELDRLLVGTRG